MNRAKLDDASLRILDALQQNAELSNAELAEIAGLSTSPCWRRVADMKEHRVLRGAVTLVDPAALGPATHVFEADFMLRVVSEDLAKYQTLLLDCLTTIPVVASIRSSFALSQVKYTTALPTNHLRGRATGSRH